MKKNLVTQTIILSLAGLIAKAIGFGIRVYISNKIGAEGMGMYSMVISVYMLLATIATSGISISVSKLCAEEIYKGNHFGARRIVQLACYVMGFVGLITFLILFINAKYIGIVWLGDVRTILSLKLISIGLPFVSISSCLTGYFYASRNVVKPASSQIFEQFIKIVSIYFLFLMWLSRGLEFSLAAAVLSITLADVMVSIYQFILYKLDKKNIINKNFSMRNTVKNLIYMSLPLALNSYINSGLRLVENLLIPFSLRKSGLSSSVSMSKYGMLKGMVMPVLVFPSAFLSSLASILVPTVASAKANKDTTKLNKTICKILQFTLLLGILIVGIFMSFSNEIGTILYNNIECGQMLFTLSFVCPFIYLDMIIVAILNGLSQQMTSLRVNLIESIIRIGIIYFITPLIGINAFLVAMAFGSIISTILYLHKLIKITKINFKFVLYVVKPCLSALAVLLTTRFIYNKIPITISHPSLGLLLGIGVSSSIYFILVFMLGCINTKDFIFLFSIVKKKKA